MMILLLVLTLAHIGLSYTTIIQSRTLCEQRRRPEWPFQSSLTDENDKASPPTGLYIHIPFCRRRCRYCNFAIVPIGDRSIDENTILVDLADNYTSAVVEEISRMDSTNVSLASIYFGGGTPSLAPLSMIESILSAIKRQFTIEPDAEMTIEIDPGTFSRDKLGALRDLGFNRLSLGVQSFDDRILEYIGRVHRRRDIFESLAMMKDVYGEELEYSLDLISGLPGLTLAQWTESLHIAVTLDPAPAHLSLYDLQVEPSTVFGTWYTGAAENQHTALPTDEESATMYKYATGYLRARGYEHYEVSSYAKLDVQRSHRSRHNQIYWHVNGQWYAAGLASTSRVKGRLQARPATLVDYLKWVKHPEAQEEREVDAYDDLQDAVLKRLRTSEGLSLDWLLERYGPEYLSAVREGVRLALDLGLAHEDGHWLRLKDPDGLLFSNTIISSIFVALDMVSSEKRII